MFIKYISLLFMLLFVLLGLTSCKGQNSHETLQAIQSNNREISHDIMSQENPISQVVRTMFQDSKGNLWFGTQNGAFKLENEVLIHIDGIMNEYGQGVTIKDITEAPDGVIWMAHTDGVSCIKGEQVKNYYQSDGLISYDAWSIEADRNGKIWIGTLDGLCVFDGQSFEPFDLPVGIIDTTLGISSERMVHQILEDRIGQMWFSTNAGLLSYQNGKLINVSEQSGIQTNFINSIFEDESGDLWVSTKIGLYRMKDNIASLLTNNEIEIGKGIGSIAKDKNGVLWLVANQNDLYSYDGKNFTMFQKTEKYKEPIIFQIFKDQQERLWMVGFGGAFRLEKGAFIAVAKDGPW